MALKPKSKSGSKSLASSKPAAPAKREAKKQIAKSAAPVAKAKPTLAAPVASTRKITLTYFAPDAASVLVAGDFTRWEASPVSLVKEPAGVWKATLDLKPGKYQYRLLVDGLWQNDPQCPDLHPNEFGTANCVMSVA